VTRPDTAGQPPGGSAAIELKAVQVATRWLVGAATAVLAVLLAGVQLSALGQLASDRPGRLAIAVIACALGLLAVGTILVLAARVLVSPGWTLSKLAHLETQHRWQGHWLRSELEAGEDQHRNRNARLAPSVQVSRGAPEAWVLLSGDIRASGHGIGQDHIGIRESGPGV
jgi:hypothetical protein